MRGWNSPFRSILGALVWLSIPVEQIHSLSVGRWQETQTTVLNVGITSTLLLDHTKLVVGSKKGRIFWHSLDRKHTATNHEDDLRRIMTNGTASHQADPGVGEVNSSHYSTKFPIYSLASTPNEKEQILFCGSGDRWISVWKLCWHEDNHVSPNIEFLQKLGPHTGWVKSLVYDESNQLLHSIGCNCIESWKILAANGTKAGANEWSHLAKRTIENSPTMGTTLSSDLLCLCLIPERYLVSGGVDGRIHLWTLDPRGKDTMLHTASAHNGRVNAIVYSSAVDAIFTVGHDGAICAYRVSHENGFEPLSKTVIRSNEPRITAVSIADDSKCHLTLGSSKGELYFATAEFRSDGRFVCELESGHLVVEEGSMIYSICCEQTSSPAKSSRLWVGHSAGLVTIER